MSGILFDYTPGRIDARFRHGSDFDYIVLRMRMSHAAATTAPCDDEFHVGKPVARVAPRIDCSVYMTSVFCPFADFIRFLEAIAVQVQECTFEWDAEGDDGRMRWQRRRVDAEGFLTVSWRGSYGGRRQEFSHRMMLDTRQTVRMLYTAFRRFVESHEYDPLRYEELTAGEAFGLILADATVEDFAAALIALDRESAERVIDRACAVVSERTCTSKAPRFRLTLDELQRAAQVGEREANTERRLDPQWDHWESEQRRAEVQTRIFPSSISGWFGSELRALRSALVEQWLASPAPLRRRGPAWNGSGATAASPVPKTGGSD